MGFVDLGFKYDSRGDSMVLVVIFWAKQLEIQLYIYCQTFSDPKSLFKTLKCNKRLVIVTNMSEIQQVTKLCNVLILKISPFEQLTARSGFGKLWLSRSLTY